MKNYLPYECYIYDIHLSTEDYNKDQKEVTNWQWIPELAREGDTDDKISFFLSENDKLKINSKVFFFKNDF